MLRLLTSLVALSASCAGVLASPTAWGGDLTPRASSSSNFSLFAYGSATDTEIGGFPLFYYAGMSETTKESTLPWSLAHP